MIDIRRLIRLLDLPGHVKAPGYLRLDSDTQEEKLRLVLGCGRSGTTWLARKLATTPSRIKYLEEPLQKLKPRLLLNNTHLDHLAVKPTPGDKTLKSLRRCYELCATEDVRWPEFMVSPPSRNDPNADFFLVKEVHSLLASEALISYLPSKNIFITRNPIMSVNSLIARDGWNSLYLAYEEEIVSSTKFIDEYFPELRSEINGAWKAINSKRGRERREFGLVFTVSLMNKLLLEVAEKSSSSTSVRYEDLLENPEVEFRRLFDFLDMQFPEALDVSGADPSLLKQRAKKPTSLQVQEDDFHTFFAKHSYPF